MIVLDQDAVGQVEAVVAAAAGHDTVFFQHPQTRRRLAGVADAHRIVFNLLDESGSAGGNARDALQQIQGHPLGFEQIDHRTADR